MCDSTDYTCVIRDAIQAYERRTDFMIERSLKNRNQKKELLEDFKEIMKEIENHGKETRTTEEVREDGIRKGMEGIQKGPWKDNNEEEDSN